MDTSTLPKAAELATRAARNPRWQPDAALPLHSEIFAPATQGVGAGAALAFVQQALRAGEGSSLEERSVLWVQDARAIKLGGRPYRTGLPEALRHRLIHVAAKTPEDALFAMEEGLSWKDSADRTFVKTREELTEWMGNRAAAGRMAPKGFPRTGKFG